MTRSLRRIVLTGIICASIAATTGIALERARFGPTDQVALARVDTSMRAEIAGVTTALGDIAAAIAREPALFDAAAVDPAGPGVRTLLDRADQALRGRAAGVFAVTAYRPSGALPLAWSGVPSEIPVDRIVGPETFFLARGPLGLRLIYIKPVLDAANHRVGVVVAERVITALGAIGTSPEEGILAIPTLVPVTVRPYSNAQPPGGTIVTGPSGQPLLVAHISAQSVAEARARWRRNTSAAALGILALTLIVSLPPLLRWREHFPALTSHLKVVGVILALIAAARVLLWQAPTAEWTDQVFHTAALGRGLRALLRTPPDFLFTMALLAAVLILAFDLSERLRRTSRHRHSPPLSRTDWGLFAATHLGAGTMVALLLVGLRSAVGNATAATSVDALHFSLHPLVSARWRSRRSGLAQAFVFWARCPCRHADVRPVADASQWRRRTGGVRDAGRQ
jgi:hypothetical protein